MGQVAIARRQLDTAPRTVFLPGQGERRLAIPKRSAIAATTISALSGWIASGTLKSFWVTCAKRAGEITIFKPGWWREGSDRPYPVDWLAQGRKSGGQSCLRLDVRTPCIS
ncbi:hypothetical protein NFI95_15885 [Acetobacteraceae bacterium KSS8]|uniref:Uncharacterized protein n=1 Tax=Endosaccharibacter trunci TaxID=2812733 RepID=A0ABT1WB11_9PROT|nr:hypothetical protein [Acetobacteraceae bacterium KSS8]